MGELTHPNLYYVLMATLLVIQHDQFPRYQPDWQLGLFSLCPRRSNTHWSRHHPAPSWRTVEGRGGQCQRVLFYLWCIAPAQLYYFIFSALLPPSCVLLSLVPCWCRRLRQFMGINFSSCIILPDRWEIRYRYTYLLNQDRFFVILQVCSEENLMGGKYLWACYRDCILYY